MTAPARTTAPARSTRSAPTRHHGAGSRRARSAAVERAYARRAQRTDRWLALTSDHEAPGSRTRVVVLVMVLLCAGLVATLWLSTAAAGDSYRLQRAQTEARNLAEQSEQLSRQVATLETAPQLARRAGELGMVPAEEPARLVVRPDGTVDVVGEPTPATAPPPPPAAATPEPDPEPAPESDPEPDSAPEPDSEPAPEPDSAPEQQALPAAGQPPGER